MKRFLNLILVVGCVVLSGCGSKSTMEYFQRDDVDIGYVNKIAILPFENNSRDQYVSGRIRDIVSTQILSNGMFDVVDKGLVDSVLREEAVDLSKAPMDATLMKRMGQRMNVQAFLMGTIDSSEKVQRGSISYPQLSITLRLVDIHTGMIFWQVSGHKTGDSLGKRLFGLANDDEFKVSLSLVRELLETLLESPSSGGESPAADEVDSGSDPDVIDVDQSEEIIIIPDDLDQG